MDFLTYCKKVATNDHVVITDDRNVPEQYEQVTNVTITILKPKMSRLDRIEIPFINAKLNSYETISDVIEEKLNGDDVPDGILNTLSDGLYGKSFNDLTIDEQSIIKVVGIYLIISI